jgi:hypothetical protein
VASFHANRFPGGGSAATYVSFCVGGVLDCQGFPGVATIIKGRPPGEIWSVELYNRGTCHNVLHRVDKLPPIRIGSNGQGRGSVTLSGRIEAAVSAGIPGGPPGTPQGLAVRLSTAGYRTCRRIVALTGS